MQLHWLIISVLLLSMSCSSRRDFVSCEDVLIAIEPVNAECVYLDDQEVEPYLNLEFYRIFNENNRYIGFAFLDVDDLVEHEDGYRKERPYSLMLAI